MLPDLVGAVLIRPYPPHDDSSDDDYSDTDADVLVHEAALLEPGQDLAPSHRERSRSPDVEMAGEPGPADPLLPAAPRTPGGDSAPPQRTRTPGRTPGRKRRGSAASLPPTEIHIGPPGLFRETDFLLLFAILAILCGVGLEWINNVGGELKGGRRLTAAVTLALARTGWDYDPHAVAAMQASQVATISVFNCAGRILGGALSDFVKVRFGVRRVSARACQ